MAGRGGSGSGSETRQTVRASRPRAQDQNVCRRMPQCGSATTGRRRARRREMGSGGVKYLLDTGVWLRAVNEVQSIPPKVLRILNAPGEAFGLAAISLWEVGKKVQSGKLPLPKDLPEWFADALAPNIEVLPISAAIITDATCLPQFPNRDPADEMIVATSRIHKLTLITTDSKLKKYRHADIHYFKPLRRKARD
jgi:PIN domain nuclease of toxin-antitoxin system